MMRDEAKAYCRSVLRLAKKTGDYSECPVDSAAMQRIERTREIENIFAAEAKDRNDGRASSRWFITWNPSQTTDPVDLWKRVTGYLQKNDGRGIKAWYAVIEQRSEDGQNPSGWHVHVCLEYCEEFARSIVYQKLKATAAYFWTDAQRKMSEYKKNWLVVKPLEDYHRKYVMGEKREEKMAKVEADKFARVRYGFPEFASGSEKIFPVDSIAHGVQEGSEVCSEAGEEAL